IQNYVSQTKKLFKIVGPFIVNNIANVINIWRKNFSDFHLISTKNQEPDMGRVESLTTRISQTVSEADDIDQDYDKDQPDPATQTSLQSTLPISVKDL